MVIEPSSSGAVIAGLGRLAGSALGGLIAAVLIQSFGLEGSAAYVVPALTFILAALICETYRWQAAYSQATLIGTLIAMRAIGSSGQAEIWIYVRDQLIDNWIGIMIGLVVVQLFWPLSSRAELSKGLRQFLQQVPLLFEASLHRALDLAVLLPQLTRLTQTSQKVFASARTEFQGEALIEENWSEILFSQTQIARQLGSMNELLAGEPSPLVVQLTATLEQFAEHLMQTCDALSGGAEPEFAALHQDIAQMQAELEALRSNRTIDQYDVAEVLQCFQLLELWRHLTQALQVMRTRLEQRAAAAANHQRRPILTLPKWAPISYSRLLEIVGLGTAVGLNLAILHHIEFPFPSAYQKVASLVLVGVLMVY